ncbi:MAG: hypothetical protein QF898_04905 [SAR202 cluster bacterium]|nr:hypothetical protein [SAR202 cluster bacterium]
MKSKKANNLQVDGMEVTYEFTSGPPTREWRELMSKLFAPRDVNKSEDSEVQVPEEAQDGRTGEGRLQSIGNNDQDSRGAHPEPVPDPTDRAGDEETNVVPFRRVARSG